MKYTISILLCFSVMGLFAQEEQLVIFTQSSDELFINSSLPLITSFAETEGIELYVKEAKEGLPSTITSTPAILFRNANGSSTYAGRYTSMNSVKNFIRSARVVPQQHTTLDKENTYVLNNGKMQIAAAIKITDLKYLDPSISELLNDDELLISALKGISKGIKDFEFKELVQLKRTDRIFYLDYHPYFVNKDSMILSIELYSQFSCIDPIYKSMDQKVSGSDISDVYDRASQILQKVIIQSLKSSSIGDAYTAIPDDTTIKEIKDLGINTPTSSTKAFAAVDSNIPLPKQWTFKSAVNNKLPILQFNFMEPLTRYVGEIRSITGNVQLDDNGQLVDGGFTANMKSLTMGEESFDKKVLKEYVKARSHPKSIFEVKEITNPTSLEWLQTSTVTIEGSMTLMKKSRYITVEANITPYINQMGEKELLIQANWTMNITDGWNIKGPDGPDPAKKTLEFSMNILMQPLK